ncbi:2-(3-amino-3-carboxypropyl)histidine synthase subunit 2-like [Sycon ciliatum]|uniref:2-(3-amino-3-carboxypropyl)histidine synthase subunit 2-like n=1 Tax=Sycon ciliatum TaxID=27933 RepID=UPI0031F69A26
MSDMVTATPFSSNDRDVVEREISPAASTDLVVEDVSAYFDLSQCAAFIVNGGYKKVALQFPDQMLRYSAAVTTLLSDAAPDSQLFVLADTSYGSCCVDEVAAEHVSADAIIHFGHSCLSSVRRLPVLYAFGHEPMNVEACAKSFREAFPDPASRVLLMCDTIYESHLSCLSSQLRTSHPELAVGNIAGRQQQQTEAENGASASLPASCLVRQPVAIDPKSAGHSSSGGSTAEQSSDQSAVNHHSRCGREFVLADGSTLDDYSVFYVGLADMALNNHMMTFSRSPLYLYNPLRSSSSAQVQTAVANRSLKRRYVKMLKAKEAKTVGVLAGTLGVADYMTLIRRLKQIIRQAGKKVYTFALGKLNVAKLANFMEIDVFVLVACPESTLIDSDDFYKPVVTPYELEVACMRSREWTGDYVTDFRLLLPGAPHHVRAEEDANSDEEPEFSMISGSLLTRHRSEPEQTEGSQAVVKRADGQLATLDSGAAFLASRSWSGLDPQLGQTAVAETIVEGRTGVAMGYSHEPGFGRQASGCGSAASGGCCRSQSSQVNAECCSKTE